MALPCSDPALVGVVANGKRRYEQSVDKSTEITAHLKQKSEMTPPADIDLSPIDIYQLSPTETNRQLHKS